MVCIINERKGQNTQRFDDVVYHYVMTCTTRKEAEGRKKLDKRLVGFQNIIVRVTGGYDLYGKMKKNRGVIKKDEE